MSLKPGDKIYILGTLHLSHGEDDWLGGQVTVKRVVTNDQLDPSDYNYKMVEIEEDPGVSWNLSFLMEKQVALAQEYKDQKAQPNPDHRSEFNDR